jgi:hypothetical protein
MFGLAAAGSPERQENTSLLTQRKILNVIQSTRLRPGSLSFLHLLKGKITMVVNQVDTAWVKRVVYDGSNEIRMEIMEIAMRRNGWTIISQLKIMFDNLFDKFKVYLHLFNKIVEELIVDYVVQCLVSMLCFFGTPRTKTTTVTYQLLL